MDGCRGLHHGNSYLVNPVTNRHMGQEQESTQPERLGLSAQQNDVDHDGRNTQRVDEPCELQDVALQQALAHGKAGPIAPSHDRGGCGGRRARLEQPQLGPTPMAGNEPCCDAAHRHGTGNASRQKGEMNGSYGEISNAQNQRVPPNEEAQRTAHQAPSAGTTGSLTVFPPPCFRHGPGTRSGYDPARSKRSRFMTLFHAATKSCTNFSCESSHA
jgi:hypothetical protein